MFYSETLLQKTGPLAKVWLAANVERKLSKGDCLKTNIEKDVRNIVNSNQAPLALRLTSQLLLGVVRIYSRKARYLLDDCNEALIKIRLAFLPGNNDLPAHQSHVANPAALNLPDTITELDLFTRIPDPEFLFDDQPLQLDQTIADWGTSQILPATLEESREPDNLLLDDEIDLELEYDAPDQSIEVGRRAEPAQADRFDNTTVLDILNDQEPTVYPYEVGDAQEEDIIMADAGKQPSVFHEPITTDPRSHRESRSPSPLSEIGADEENELERTFQLDAPQDLEEEPSTVQANQHVAKRRKILQNDSTTELSSQLHSQHTRAADLKDPVFLPKDPVLLALMNMQKSGGFVSSILGNGRTAGWAPELRSVLSLDIVRRAGDLKRKRNITPLATDIPEEEEPVVQEDNLDVPADEYQAPPDEVVPDIDITAPLDEPQSYIASPGLPGFDETTVPLVAPADSGPVSLGTKHAVHMLRETFATADGNEPESSLRAQQSVKFTDLCPEGRTTKQDATKMFFETLVLGTKDAIKVEQAGGVLGGEIRIRGKRGLWGAWAETEVSQSQSQVQDLGADQLLNEGSRMVAVAA